MKRFLFSLLGSLLLAPWAHAQQVLVLSPNEVTSGAGFINNAYNAFSAAAGASNMVDGRGVLGSATPDASLLNGPKVVVIATTYAQINPAWVPVLRDAMLHRPDLTFVMFNDGCCQTQTNLAPFVSIINEGTGWNLGRSAYQNTLISSPLNTNSLYAGSFTGLNPMLGGFYELITNVPSDNALYLANGVTTPPATDTRTSAYAFFVPQRRFNNGQGACMFMTSDVSPFNFSAQFSAIAQSFMHAANDPAGACKQATREPDLVIALTGPASPPVGQPATYTATVTNQGASPSAAGSATIHIPAGMTVDTATLPAGCTAAGQTVTCSVSALAAGANQAFAINVTPTQLASAPMTAAVGAVAGEANTANNATSLPVNSTGAPDLVSSVVPPATLAVGTPAVFTLTVTNQGNLPSSDGSVTLTIPAGLTADSAALPAGCTLAGQVITCQAGALAPGAAQSWPIALTPTAAGSVTLTTNVAGVTGETNTGNNAGTVVVNPTGAPDLVSSVAAPATLTVGTPATFTLRVMNQGNLPSSDGSVTLTIPAGLTADPAALPAGCTLAGQVITCQAGALAPGAAQSWPIVLTPTTAGPIALATNVTGVTGEANAANNVSTVNATVIAAPAIQPVPTLSFWSLLGLSTLLPLLTRRRKRG